VLIVCALFILPQTGLAVFHTTAGATTSRARCQSFADMLIIAFSLMPLASAVAINFRCCSPRWWPLCC
jgi:hypothetical protein